MTLTAEDIKKDIIDQLYWDDRVDVSDVNVNVKDGKVTLHGTVPTLIARHYAAADALIVAGVRELDNRLTVRYPTSVTAPSDEQIRSNVDNILQWNAHINAEYIRVLVKGGIVTLEGSVASLWQKNLTEEIVLQLTGVTAIENKLTVVPTKDTSDEMISELFLSALKRDPTINEDAIGIRVTHGVIRLTGAVPNWAVRNAVYRTAMQTFGAIAVDDKLMVAID